MQIDNDVKCFQTADKSDLESHRIKEFSNQIKQLREEMDAGLRAYNQLEMSLNHLIKDFENFSGSKIHLNANESLEEKKEVEPNTNKETKLDLKIPQLSLLNLEPKYFNHIGYITICSSVVSVGNVVKESNSTSNKKSALFGAGDDVFHIEQLFKCLGNNFKKEGKYEFSKDSVSSVSKEQFLTSLQNFFNYPKEASVIYYSGHGFGNTDLLFESGLGNYYVNYDDIISTWNNRSQPEKNKVLLILLDCCFSGSWVARLLKGGDFKDVMIQSSSTYDQLSNDLGENLGSLFTNFLIHSNMSRITKAPDNFYQIGPCINKAAVRQLMKEQTPRGFCFEDLKTLNFELGGINITSWDDELIEPKRLSYQDSQLQIEAFVIADKNNEPNMFSCYRHMVFRIEVGYFTGQGEIPVFGESKEVIGKYKYSFLYENPNIQRQLKGVVSIYEEENLQGVYFNNCLGTTLKFKIEEEVISSTINSLSKCLNMLETDTTQINHSPINDILSSITVMNRQAILSDDNIEDEEAEDPCELVQKLKEDKGINFRKLDLDCEISSNLEKLLHDYIKSNDCNLEYIGFENNSQSTSIKPMVRSANSIRLNINSNSINEFAETLDILNSDLKEISIKIKPDCAALQSPSGMFIEKLCLSATLTHITLDGMSFINEYFLPSLAEIETLVSMSISNYRFQYHNTEEALRKVFLDATDRSKMANFNTLAILLNALASHKRLKKLKITNCYVKEINALSTSLNEIDLSNNYIGDASFIDLLSLLEHLKLAFTVDLSNNCLTDQISPNVINFIRKQKNCSCFNLYGNTINPMTTLKISRNFLDLNSNLTSLNVSDTDLSVCYDDFLQLFKNNKQLISISVSKCKLNGNILVKFMDILSINCNNTITNMDLSHNHITKMKDLKGLITKLMFTKKIKNINLDSCLKISDAKADVDIKSIFACPILEEANISNWHCNDGRAFTCGKVSSKKFKSLKAVNTALKVMNLELKELDLLCIDITTISNVNLLYCSRLHLNINSETSDFLFSASNVIQRLKKENKLTELKLIGGSQQVEEILFKSNILEIPNDAVPSETSEFKQKFSFELKLDYLIAENIDQSACDFLQELVRRGLIFDECSVSLRDTRQNLAKYNCFNKNINSLEKLKRELEFTCNGQQISSHKVKLNRVELSHLRENLARCNELLSYCQRAYRNLDYAEVQIIFSPYQKINLDARYLVLNMNAFDINQLLDSTFPNLEVLQLDSVYLKSFLRLLKGFISRHSGLKGLILRNSELNSKELGHLLEILEILRDSVVELHFVNTYVDGKEFAYFYNRLRNTHLSKLSVLNLSQNYMNSVFTESLIAFIQSTNIKSLFLSDCCLSEKNVLTLLNSIKEFQILDISGLCFDTQALELGCDEKNCLYSMEINYSADSLPLRSVPYKLRHLALNNLDTEKNKNWLYKAFRKIPYLNSLIINKFPNDKTSLYTLKSIIKNTRIVNLDFSGSIVNKSNVNDLVSIINSQAENSKHSEFGQTLKVNLSKTQLDDMTFRALFNSISSNDVLIDISYNMLSTASAYKLYMTQRHKDIFSNKKYSFSGELCPVRIFAVNNNYNTIVNDIDKINNLKYSLVDPDASVDVEIQEIQAIKRPPHIMLSNLKERNFLPKEFASIQFSLYSPKVRYLISIDNLQVITVSESNCIKCICLLSSRLIRQYTNCRIQDISTLSKLSDNLFAIGYSDGVIEIRKVSNVNCYLTLNSSHEDIKSIIGINEVCFASCGSRSPKICIWDLNSFEVIRILKGIVLIEDICRISDSRLATLGEDTAIYIWNVNQDNEAENVIVNFIQDNKFRNTIGNSDLELFFKINRLLTDEIIGNNEKQKLLYYKPRKIIKFNETHLLVALMQIIRIIDIETGCCVQQIKEKFHMWEGIIFDIIRLDDRIVLSLSEEGELNYWDSQTGDIIISYEPNQENKARYSLIGSLDMESFICYNSSQKLLRVLRSNLSNQLGGLNKKDFNTEYLSSLVIIDESTIAIGNILGSIGLWDIFNDKLIWSSQESDNRINSLCLLNKHTLVSCSELFLIKIWDLKQFKCLFEFENEEKNIFKLISITNDSFGGISPESFKIWSRKSGAVNFVFSKLIKFSDQILNFIPISEDLIVVYLITGTLNAISISTEEVIVSRLGNPELAAICKITSNRIACKNSQNCFIIWDLLKNKEYNEMNFAGEILNLFPFSEDLLIVYLVNFSIDIVDINMRTSVTTVQNNNFIHELFSLNEEFLIMLTGKQRRKLSVCCISNGRSIQVLQVKDAE